MIARNKELSTLLDGVTTNKQSPTIAIVSDTITVEAMIKGTGAVSGTVTWYGCCTKRATQGIVFATSTLSGSGSDQTAESCAAVYPFVYCILTLISGTNASVTANVAA